MTNFDHDDLPPDLSDLGRRMHDERPVAEDAALDRMMQRAHTARRPASRRALAASLGAMVAMVSVTGVAAASLFGMNFSQIGKALTSSNQKVGTVSAQVLKAPAPTRASSSSAATSASSSRRPSALGSAIGSIAGLVPSGGGAASGAPSPSANLIPGNQANAGLFQYGPGRLVCRILRALRLNFVARLLGCP